jgi:glycosyltransferase involved in cell wall biosynthesis
MDVPAGLAWELVIVDNGSRDETPAVVQGFAGKLPIRRTFEPKPGLSNARNHGVGMALGRHIVWTDDDVKVERGWLASYVEAFRRAPEAAVFGGPVLPILEPPTPAWWIEALPLLGNILADRNLGPDPVPLSLQGDALPFGANFAVRADVQRRFRFDPQLGVAPGQRRLGEETEVIRAIFASGGSGWWVPGARVEHIIPAARQSEAYVEQYYRSIGETWAYLDEKGTENFMGSKVPPGGRRIGGAPLWVWRKTLWHRLMYRLLRPSASPERWLPELGQSAYFRGAIDYWRRYGRPLPSPGPRLLEPAS